MLRLVVPSKNLPKPSVDNFILVTTNEHDGQVDEVTISLTECIEADKLRGVTAPMPGGYCIEVDGMSGHCISRFPHIYSL